MKRSSTAEVIAEAARGIFEQEGPAGVTMRRVAEAVGVTAMAIYRHYPNREALLRRIADDGFETLVEQWSSRPKSASPQSRLQGLLDGYLDYAFAQPKIFDFIFSDVRDDARRFPEDFRAGLSPTANLLAEAVADGMRQGRLRRDDVWEVALAVWAHAHGLICLYRAGRFNLTEEQFRALYRRSNRRLLRGLEA
jgi:AcrR family transcriptional regulator